MKSLLTAVAILVGMTLSLAAQPLAGRWDAKIVADADYSLPFPIEFSERGGQVTASFFNGDERVTSTGGTFKAGSLVIEFAHYDSRLEATLEHGVLKGKYGGGRGGLRDFEARPHTAKTKADVGQAPEIGGLWDIPFESVKGEKAWRFIVRQRGDEVSAAILRVDGDTGTLRGSWQGDRFVLNLFDGARGSTLEIVPKPDATLALSLRSLRGEPTAYTAIRPDAARARGLAAPDDPAQHTRVKNPAEPFAFAFPDLSGRIVSNTDERFRNKVIIVNVTGSWCPNCHDEAPYLQALYKKYRSLGLEIVALDFEDAEQLKKRTRLPAFIKKYGIEYTYLVGGEPKDVGARLPQTENLNTWPATFFLGRDGRVRAVHAGIGS
ncbi:MAG: TlpA disulfide reductase family protein [Verrucomicrobia bacterium]|nr:TlpA disulfide reductase family protein [Verrucomicrobiota bacterium]